MAPELKGDLEAILLKTLRKDPQERYETVEHFAEDLQAFLDSRPVRLVPAIPGTGRGSSCAATGCL
jgi:hypothetical protein